MRSVEGGYQWSCQCFLLTVSREGLSPRPNCLWKEGGRELRSFSRLEIPSPNALLKQDGLQLAEASFRDFEGFHPFFFMRFIELSMVCIDFWIIVSMFARCSWMFQRFYRVFSDLYWFFWIVPIDWFWRIHWYSIVFGDFSMVFNGFQWFFDGFHRYVDVVRRFVPWFLSFFSMVFIDLWCSPVNM